MAIRVGVTGDARTQVKEVIVGGTKTQVKKVIVGTPVRRINQARGYLNQLNDVDVTDLKNGSLLIYSNVSSKWEASTLLEEQEINGGSF